MHVSYVGLHVCRYFVFYAFDVEVPSECLKFYSYQSF